MTVDDALALAEAFPEQMRGLAGADPGSIDLADGLADALAPEILEYCFGTRDRDGLKRRLAALRSQRSFEIWMLLGVWLWLAALRVRSTEKVQPLS